MRKEAARLRAKLASYYQGSGSVAKTRIELPKGHYIPVFFPHQPGALPLTPPAKQPVAPRKRPQWALPAAIAFVLLAGGAMVFRGTGNGPGSGAATADGRRRRRTLAGLLAGRTGDRFRVAIAAGSRGGDFCPGAARRRPAPPDQLWRLREFPRVVSRRAADRLRAALAGRTIRHLPAHPGGRNGAHRHGDPRGGAASIGRRMAKRLPPPTEWRAHPLRSC